VTKNKQVITVKRNCLFIMSLFLNFSYFALKRNYIIKLTLYYKLAKKPNKTILICCKNTTIDNSFGTGSI
jgi:hypothetical protein